MKNLWIKIWLATAMLCAAVASNAQALSVTVDGDPVQFATIGPRMVGGRVLVPLRGVMEKIGAFVEWTAATRTVTASKGDIDLSLRIGDRTAIVNGRTVSLDVPGQIISGTTMVPLRFMGEALGADVTWDAPTQTVMISSGTRGGGGGGGTTGGDGGTTGGGGGTTGGGGGTTGGGGGGNTNVDISSFNHTARGWLRAGQTVDFTLRGTPGARATVSIPGLMNELAMTEIRPGEYTAEWTPRARQDQNVAVTDGAVLGRLRLGNNEKLIQAGTNISIDLEVPKFTNIAPENGARVTGGTPEISADFNDAGGSGIDRATLRIAIDGRDTPLTGARITDRYFSFIPRTALAGGRHDVVATVDDKAGNRGEQRWTFDVEAASTGTGIKAFTSDVSGAPTRGEILNFTLTGEAGARVYFHLGDVQQNIPMPEASPGVYKGRYTVKATDNFNNIVPRAWLITKAGPKYTATLPAINGSAATAGRPNAPTITSHKTGTTATSPLVLKGKAQANSRVTINIDYTTTLLGVLKRNGNLGTVEVTTDANGNWQTEPLDLDLGMMQGSNTEYTITVTAANREGESSSETKITLKKG